MPWSVGGASEWEAVDLAPDHGGVWLSTGDALESWRFLPEGVMRPVGPRQVWDGSYSEGDRIERVSWTPDGTALVAAASDGSITRWDVASGEKTWEHVHDCDDSGAPRQDRECRIDGVGVHGDTAWVVYYDELVELPVATGANARHRAWSEPFHGRLADGRWVSVDGALAAGPDIERMRPLSSVDVEELVVNGDRMVGRLRDGRLQQLDPRGRAVGAPLPSATGDELASLNISPDGNLITEGSGEKNVVRDARTGETRHETRSIGMVFSPDSTWLAAAGATTELLHLPSGQRVDLQPPRPGYAVRTAFSPDGRHLALVETDMEAGDQLWVVDVSAAAAAAGLSLD
jgi:WD40 repeat protein